MDDSHWSLESSVEWLRGRLAGRGGQVVFLTAGGNVGDHLIWEGTRRLLQLAGVDYREHSLTDPEGISAGETALVCGSGGWCRSFHAMPEWVRRIEQRTSQVIVLPSTFDPTSFAVREFLLTTTAHVVAREQASLDLIRPLCNSVSLAHDTALSFDFSPWKRIAPRFHLLRAFRVDCESGGGPIPAGNRDVSLEFGAVEPWLNAIADYHAIHTDRAHVMIAAAMMGRTVRYRAGNYFKLPAIAAHSLNNLNVAPLEECP